MLHCSACALAVLALHAHSAANPSQPRQASPNTDDQESRLRNEYQRYRDALAQDLKLVPVELAQASRPVRLKALLNDDEIEQVHRAARDLAAQRPDATVDRSAWGQPPNTWLVTFLNTDGAFEQNLPYLHARIRDAALEVDRLHWNSTADIANVNFRVIEHHTMQSTLDGQPTRGGLHTQRHCDQGSLITVDIILTDPMSIEGGTLQTLEPDGTLLDHEWEKGDALVFLSHKYHCVSELTRGTRNVLVCELWQGTENQAPSREEIHRWRGDFRD